MKIRVILLACTSFSLSGFAEPTPYAATNLWEARSVRYSQSSPALDVNGVVYVTSLDGWLYAINPDGRQRWMFKIGFESASSPAIGSDGTIFFGSRNRCFYAVDRNGQKKWEFKTGGWVDASPAIGLDGTVYFGSWDNTFYALGGDGKMKWKFTTDGSISSSAAIDAAGTIYFGSHDGKCYALGPDGVKRWAYSTGGQVVSSPAIAEDGTIYFSSTDGRLYAVNPDGARRWELHTGGFTSSSPVIGEDGAIFISVNASHCALTPDGNFKWRRGFWHPPPNCFGESAASVLANGHVVFTGGDGYVMTVPAEEGDKFWVWNCWLGPPAYSSVVVATNGTIYAMGLFSSLKALQGNVPLAKSSWPMFRADPQHTGRVRSTH